MGIVTYLLTYLFHGSLRINLNALLVRFDISAADAATKIFKSKRFPLSSETASLSRIIHVKLKKRDNLMWDIY